MSRFAAVALIALALVAGGVWLGFGDRIVQAPATAVGEPEAAQDEAGADPDAPTVDTADERVIVEPLVDEPVRRFDAPEEVLDPDLDYSAVIDTTAGSFGVELHDDRAPRTVNNFVFLALHRFYEDVPFYRVLEDFMAQTGDPTGTGTGGPGYAIDDEIAPELRHDRPGILSMANAGPDTNGSQFFVTFEATPWLDGAHPVFGTVTDGFDTLDALTRIDPTSPSALARLSDPASALADGGVSSAQGFEGTVEEWLHEELGTVPVQGQNVRIGDRLGVLLDMNGAPALGLFPVPDRIERVIILAAPEEESE